MKNRAYLGSTCILFIVLGSACQTLLPSAPAAVGESTVFATGSLRVRTVYHRDTEDGQGTTVPAGNEVSINIDGNRAGRTNEYGEFTAALAPGDYTIQGIVPSYAYAEATVTIEPSEPATIDLLLDDSVAVVRGIDLSVPELTDGILPHDVSTFTIIGRDGSNSVEFEYVDEISLLGTDDDVLLPLDGLFVIAPGGHLVVTELDELLSSFEKAFFGNVRVQIQAVDTAGFTYAGAIEFRVGQYTISGEVLAPENQTELPRNDLNVSIDNRDTGYSFFTKTQNGGLFELDRLLPIGNYVVTVHTTHQERDFYATTVVRLDEDKVVDLILYSPGSRGNAISRRSADDAALNENLGEIDLYTFNGGLVHEAEVLVPKGSLAISVSGFIVGDLCPSRIDPEIGCDLAPIRGTASYLGYANIEVFLANAKKERLFHQTQVIDEFNCLHMIILVSCMPFWRCATDLGDGCEFGFPEEWGDPVIDLGDRALEQDLRLIVRVTLTQDSRSPYELSCCECRLPVCTGPIVTAFYASIDVAPALQVAKIDKDVVRPTLGQSDSYSIPRKDARNFHHRHFDLSLRKPADVRVTSVKVTAVIGESEVELLDEKIGTANTDPVRMVGEKVRILATYRDRDSTVVSQPPQEATIAYKFLVRAEDSIGSTLEGVGQIAPLRPLWRMPNEFWPAERRYSLRVNGGDDWTAMGTYEWMGDNLELLLQTRINDISEEHARNLGGHRASHERGTDLDIFHFYTFPGAGSGGDNYQRLAQAVVQAISNNDAQARQRVTAWVTQSREALTTLLDLETVERVRYARGDCWPRNPDADNSCEDQELLRDWAMELLRAGSTHDADGNPLNLGLDPWRPEGQGVVPCGVGSRLRCDTAHNSHIHVNLDEAEIGAGFNLDLARKQLEFLIPKRLLDLKRERPLIEKRCSVPSEAPRIRD